MGWLILIIAISAAITWFAVEPKKQLTVRPEIQMLIDLMAMNKDWVKRPCVWYHPSGVSVWVGNKDFALSVKWGAKDQHDYAGISDAGEWRFNATEYRKAMKVIKNCGHVASDKKVAAVAARIAEMYGS